jgi:hypothetical protein
MPTLYSYIHIYIYAHISVLLFCFVFFFTIMRQQQRRLRRQFIRNTRVPIIYVYAVSYRVLFTTELYCERIP